VNEVAESKKVAKIAEVAEVDEVAKNCGILDIPSKW
jgi:hypothetical protein